MLYHYNVRAMLFLLIGLSSSLGAGTSSKKRLSHRIPQVQTVQKCVESSHEPAPEPPAVAVVGAAMEVAAGTTKDMVPERVLPVSTLPAVAEQHVDAPAEMKQPVSDSQESVAQEPALVSSQPESHLCALKKARSCQIRVLIDEAIAEDSNRIWRIGVIGGGVLVDEHGKRPTVSFDSELTTISYKDGAWYFGTKRLISDRVLIRSREGSIMCDGVAYYGSLYLVIDQNKHKAFLINCLDLEDYVYSVLCPEGYPGWPLEMNKVLAIAIRTYAAQMIFKQAGKGRPYHIKNTIIHQVYGGKPCSLQLRRAVDETRGIILTYDDEPIIAMYHICCGGVVPSLTHGINFKEAPYLARTKSCNYCKPCKDYHWHVSIKRNDLEVLLKSQFPRLGRLRHVRVARKDKSGVVKEVEIVARGGVFRLSGKKMYGILKGAHSACFTIDEIGNTFIYKGRGYGHHMGMCQLGACKMVKQGHNFKQVLSFYYPGTRFMKIKDREEAARAA